MFDTHTHLNFKRFSKNIDDVIARAHGAGVTHMLIPGTDITSSKKAIEIAEKFDDIYAAVGIHPHHVFDDSSGHDIENIPALLAHPKVLAIGETGMDRHRYNKTKYEDYSVSEDFIMTQRKLFEEQIKLAVKHKKSLIIHNREATDDMLEIVARNWDSELEHRTVIHCCEPDERILDFARKHRMFIGVDGDVTYDTTKQDFIKKVPLEMLVLETDSPFLLPEPLKSQKKYPNEPKNLVLIAEKVARIKKLDLHEIAAKTKENARTLFGIH